MSLLTALIRQFGGGGSTSSGGSTPPTVLPYTNAATTYFAGFTPTPLSTFKEVAVTHFGSPVIQKDLTIRKSFANNLDIVEDCQYPIDANGHIPGNGTASVGAQYGILDTVATFTGHTNNYHTSEVVRSGDNIGPMIWMQDYHPDNDPQPAGYYSFPWGGNHGYPALELTKSGGHGMTINDIGSTRLFAGKTFYIAQIINADSLLLISENTSTEGGIGVYYAAEFNYSGAANHLTYGANGTNTGNLYFDSIVDSHGLLGLTDFDEPQFYLNGALIDLSAEFTRTDVTSLQQTQTLHFKDPWSAMAAVVTNRGGGYTVAPRLNQGDTWFIMHIINDYQDDVTVCYTAFELVHKSRLLDYGGQQDEWNYNSGGVWAPPSWLNEVTRYIPSLLPIDNGSGGPAAIYDFRTGEPQSTRQFGAGHMCLNVDYEDGLPPLRQFDRYSGTMLGKTFDGVYNIGSLPLDSVTTIATDSIASWLIPASNYSYPLLRWFANPGELKDPGYAIKAVMFRGFARNPTTPGVINEIRPVVYGVQWIIMDFDTAGSYTLGIPTGLTFTATRLKNASVSGNTVTVTSTYAHVEGYCS